MLKIRHCWIKINVMVMVMVMVIVMVIFHPFTTIQTSRPYIYEYHHICMMFLTVRDILMFFA